MKSQLNLLLITSILFLTFERNAFSQWVETPLRGEVTTLAVSDTNASLPMLFAGTYGGGIFLSTDNGVSWDTVNTGLTSLNVEDIAIRGTVPTMLFASTADGGKGVFCSTNDGTSWQAVNTGLPTNLGTYINIGALGVRDTNLYAAGTADGVFHSTNNGASWDTLSSDTGLSPYLLVSAFGFGGTSASPILFAGIWGDSGVYFSRNNGTSWTPVTGLSYTEVLSLAIMGSANLSTPILFVGSETSNLASGGVFRSTDNGTSWTSESTGLMNSDVFALAAIGTNLFAGTDNGIFLSTDSGVSWTSENDGITSTLISSFALIGTNLFVGSDSTNSSGYTVGGSVWRRPLSEMIPLSAVAAGGPLFQYLYIKLYPTPTSNTLNVELDGMYIAPVGTLTCGLYDILGRHMLDLTNEAQRGNNGYISVFSFNVNSLPDGVYTLVYSLGGYSYSHSIVVIH